LSHLKSLDLTYTYIGDELTKDIVQALASSCHDLRKIDLTGMGGSSHAIAASFHEALTSNTWPRLEVIKVIYWTEGMAGDLVSILAATGVGTSLRHIEVGWPFYDGLEVQLLADTFHKGACMPGTAEVLRLHITSKYFGWVSKGLDDSLAGRASVEIYEVNDRSGRF